MWAHALRYRMPPFYHSYHTPLIAWQLFFHTRLQLLANVCLNLSRVGFVGRDAHGERGYDRKYSLSSLVPLA